MFVFFIILAKNLRRKKNVVTFFFTNKIRIEGEIAKFFTRITKKKNAKRFGSHFSVIFIGKLAENKTLVSFYLIVCDEREEEICFLNEDNVHT